MAADLQNDEPILIPKVPALLLMDEKTKEDCIPKVVSIGPYHHAKPELHQVEAFKPTAVRLFVAGGPHDESFYNHQVHGMIDGIQNYYEQESVAGYERNDLATMMLHDACLIIIFMEAATVETWPPNQSTMAKILAMNQGLGMLTTPIIWRDLFLLENQIPLSVIKLLMDSRHGNGEYERLLGRFLEDHLFGEYRQKATPGQLNRVLEQQPCYLLEAFHILLTTDCPPPAAQDGAAQNGAAQEGAAEDHGAAQDGVAQDGAVAAQNGRAQDGAAQNDAAQHGAAQDDAAQDGVDQDGAAQNSAAQDGAAQNDAAQDGAAQNDAAQHGAAQDDAAQEGVAQDGEAQDNAAQEAQDEVAENSAAQDGAAQNDIAQDGAAQNDAAQHGAAQDDAAQDGAAQNSAAQDRTTQCGAAQDRTAQDHGAEQIQNQAANGNDVERGLIDDLHSRRSVTYLKTKGIRCKPSCAHRSLIDVKFKSKILSATLELPKWCVSVFTRVYFSNMIAYEFSPNNRGKGEVTSYVNFVKSLIESSEDVRELREKRILFNKLGSDGDVVKMYKDINTYGANNLRIFQQVREKIRKRCDSKTKTWMADLRYTHFRTPWTVIAFLAAATLLALTAAQVYYAINPNKRS